MGAVEASLASDDALPPQSPTYRPDDELTEPEAQFAAGVRYALGEGVDQDWTAAGRYIRSAAEQGHSQAQLFLGDMFAHWRLMYGRAG